MHDSPGRGASGIDGLLQVPSFQNQPALLSYEPKNSERTQRSQINEGGSDSLGATDQSQCLSVNCFQLLQKTYTIVVLAKY